MENRNIFALGNFNNPGFILAFSFVELTQFSPQLICRNPDDIIVRGTIDLVSPIYPVTNLLFGDFFGVSAELVLCDVEKKVPEEGSAEKV
jgi:hypothetical protein